MIPASKIEEAVAILRDAASPARIILFGSYARGDAGDDSDLDFLVVEKNVQNTRAEMVRLRRALRPLRIPVDIIVASENSISEFAGLTGTVYYPAMAEGRVMYEAA